MASWGPRRPFPMRDRNCWFYQLWGSDFKAGRGYRPLAGDQLKVWDSTGNVYTGTIEEVRSFLYSSHGEVRLALGGVSEHDVDYVASRPSQGWCVAVRAELNQAVQEPCPIAPPAAWAQLG